MLELLGVLVGQTSFWNGLSRVAVKGLDAGLNLKSQVDADRLAEIKRRQESLDRRTRLPSFTSGFRQVAAFQNHARSVLDWREVTLGFTDTSDLIPGTRALRDGQGWIYGKAEPDCDFVIQLELFERFAHITIATAIPDGDWFIARAELTRHTSDNSPCELQYVGEAFRPNKESWSGLLFGPTDRAIEEACSEHFEGQVELLSDYLEAMDIPSSSFATELEKIADLRAKELLTPAEFEVAKRKLLES